MEASVFSENRCRMMSFEFQNTDLNMERRGISPLIRESDCGNPNTNESACINGGIKTLNPGVFQCREEEEGKI